MLFHQCNFTFSLAEAQNSVLLIYLHYILSKGAIQSRGFQTSDQRSSERVKVLGGFPAAGAVVAALHLALGANCTASS